MQYYNGDKGEFIRMNLADGSVVIIRQGKDGFFNEDFDQARRYALNMRRLLDFLEEREKAKTDG